jgi:outer membrane protein
MTLPSRTALAAGAALAAMLAAAPARADTLRDALLQAYESNPTLLAARANLRATDENVPIQRAAGLPSVDANSRLTEFLIQDQSSFLAPERALNAGLNLAVPLYNGGAVRNSVRAAEQRIEAGRAELRGTESALFTQVVAAYMNVLRDEAVVGLAQNQVNVLDINLQATRDRFEIGILTRTDVAQSEARLALARGDLQSAQSNLIGSRENYISLVGDAPDDLAHHRRWLDCRRPLLRQWRPRLRTIPTSSPRANGWTRPISTFAWLVRAGYRRCR